MDINKPGLKLSRTNASKREPRIQNLSDQHVILASLSPDPGSVPPILLENSVQFHQYSLLFKCLSLLDSTYFSEFISVLNCSAPLLSTLNNSNGFESFIESYEGASSNFSQSAPPELLPLVEKLRALPPGSEGVPSALAELFKYQTSYNPQTAIVLESIISMDAPSMQVNLDVGSNIFSISPPTPDANGVEIFLTDTQQENISSLNKFFERFPSNATYENKINILYFLAATIDSSELSNTSNRIFTILGSALASLAIGIPLYHKRSFVKFFLEEQTPSDE